MLLEIYSPVFKEKDIVRPPIMFKSGLNVIQGTKSGSNSIGKSSALLAIDFVFGGDTYLKSDGVKYVGNHTLYFCFAFDEKYFFSRSTSDPDKISVCNEKYESTEKTYTKKMFTEWLKNKYFNNKLDLESDKLKTFRNSRKYSFISNIVGGKAQYEENVKTLSKLQAELESLTLNYDVDVSNEEIENNKVKENLRANKVALETQLERLQRQSKLLDISMEFGLYPTEADLQSLSEFFPNVNIKKIYDVERYHKKLSVILNEEFSSEKELVDSKIRDVKAAITTINNRMSELKITNSISKDFLDKHSELIKKIDALTEQNKAYLDEIELQESKKSATQNLEKNVESILSEIQFELNKKMHEFNNLVYSEKRNSPKIELKNYNSYKFFTPKDTGTGTNFKSLILLDLSILYLSSLPVLAHDSLFFKNIDDEGIDGIIKLYSETVCLGKQVFIAFDKQSSYSSETYDILQKNKVLQLYRGGGELYGKSWNSEVDDEHTN